MERITKDYQRIKIFALHLRPYIPIPQYWPRVFCVYDILAEYKLSCKSPTFRKLFRKSPPFNSALIILFDIFLYARPVYIFTQNIERREVSRSQFTGNLKLI